MYVGIYTFFIFMLNRSLCQRLFDLTPEPIPGHIKDLVAAGQNADKNTPTSTEEASEITE